MSIKLTSKAWETNQRGNDLLVLLALCDFSNDEGLSFPSLKTLSNKAKVSKTTLSYILRAYEDIGVITRVRRVRDNKSDTSTLYKINHLNIDSNEYQKAYQKARKYISKSDESSQCEHPLKDTIVNTGSKIVNTGSKIVNTGSKIVNTLSANCEHLEPSSINHQDINHQDINHQEKKPEAEIISYLNGRLGTRYKHSSVETVKKIKARMNEGFTVEDFKTVIDKKVMLWKNDIKMSAYLRPETLFGNKFEGYLNEIVSNAKAMSANGVLSEKTAKGYNAIQEFLND